MTDQNRPDLRDDYAETGLPTASDYDPDALGTVAYRSGDPVQQWPEYGIELVPVEYQSKTQEEWVDTGRRHVVRNGKYLSDVSEQYKLLPNEHLIGVANDVARDLGAEPFHEFDGDWFVTLDDHVFQDSERRRVHGVYAWQSGTVGDDAMEYGFAVHNSIDASLGFSVGLFTFRHACKNMVFLGTSGSLEQMALDVESDREILNRHSQKHTASLDVDADALAATIKGTVTLLENIDETYEAWLEQHLTPTDVRDLLQRPNLSGDDLPDWMTEIEDAIDETYEDEYSEGEEMPWEDQARIIEAEMPEAEPVWDTYNDLTEAIWHNTDTQDQTKQRKFRDVHKVFNPAPEAGVTVR